MTFREIAFGSPEFAAEVALRNEVLRVPLGLALDDDLSAEERQWHFGNFGSDGRLLACAIAVPLAGDGARVRQVAVLPECQGRGIGRLLIERLEVELARRGSRQVVLHARSDVEPFYLALGYSRVGEEFIEVSIPHVEMEKRIG